MSLLNFLRFIIYSNLFIALAAFFYSIYSGGLPLFLPETTDLKIPLFNFFSTLFFYNYQRLIKFDKIGPVIPTDYNNWIKSHHKTILIITIISGLASFIFFISLPLIHWLFYLLPGLISFLYVLPKGFRNELRNVPHLKVYLICMVWSITVGFIPAFEQNNSPEASLLQGIQTFFFFMAITIPFDIRDMKIDRPELKTIPIYLGIRKAKIIAFAFIALYLLSALWKFNNDQSYVVLLSEAFTAFFSAIAIYWASLNRHHLYYSGLMDGLIFIPFLLFRLFYVL